MAARLGPEPRVNSKYLREHVGQTVRLVAKVINIHADTATVEASDGGQGYIYRESVIPHHLYGFFEFSRTEDMRIADTYVEIIGMVKDDKTVKALTSINLGNTLDMKAVQAVVEFSHSSRADGVL